MHPTHVRCLDGWLGDDLQSQLIEAVSWVPLYHVRRSDRVAGADPLEAALFYPLADIGDIYSDDIEPQISQLEPPLSVVGQVWRKLKPLIGDVERLNDCEVVGNPYGLEGHPHHDIMQVDRRASHCTAIIYCNPEWLLEWAGETLVFSDAGEVTHGIVPRPGRATLIFGDPLHVARAVSRHCPVARRALVFKMWMRRLAG